MPSHLPSVELAQDDLKWGKIIERKSGSLFNQCMRKISSWEPISQMSVQFFNCFVPRDGEVELAVKQELN